jgi:hypothetical protein
MQEPRERKQGQCSKERMDKERWTTKLGCKGLKQEAKTKAERRRWSCCKESSQNRHCEYPRCIHHGESWVLPGTAPKSHHRTAYFGSSSSGPPCKEQCGGIAGRCHSRTRSERLCPCRLTLAFGSQRKAWCHHHTKERGLTTWRRNPEHTSPPPHCGRASSHGQPASWSRR